MIDEGEGDVNDKMSRLETWLGECPYVIYHFGQFEGDTGGQSGWSMLIIPFAFYSTSPLGTVVMPAQ